MATGRIAEDADYEGVRATFQATLGNVRLPMQIDIGFSDLVTPEPVSITYPTLLGQPAPELSAYNRETAIAEKFEAMVKLGELNSRMKDFFDVSRRSQKESFRAQELGAAVARTFQRRDTPISVDPVCFGETFAASAAKAVQWQAFVRRGRFADPVPAFAEVVGAVAGFLRPVCSALLTGRMEISVWPPGGPWMR